LEEVRKNIAILYYELKLFNLRSHRLILQQG